MKQPITFSVERSVISNFLDQCELINESKNDVVSTLICNWLENKRVYTIKCQECGAVFSNKCKDGCPACSMEKQEIKTHEEAENAVLARRAKITSIKRKLEYWNEWLKQHPTEEKGKHISAMENQLIELELQESKFLKEQEVQP